MLVLCTIDVAAVEPPILVEGWSRPWSISGGAGESQQRKKRASAFHNARPSKQRRGSGKAGKSDQRLARLSL